jgi:P27 family predicted phage terminase small subunit
VTAAVAILMRFQVLKPFFGSFSAIMTDVGQRGPMPMPAGLKILAGTSPGRDSGGRPVAKPPAFERYAPDPPPWLEGEALAEWRRVAPTLEALDLIKPEDAAMLAAYCLTWQTVADMSAIIRAEGFTTANPSGRMVAHPAAVIRAAAIRDLRPLAAHFGLTPWSESNLAAATGDTDVNDPFAG